MVADHMLCDGQHKEDAILYIRKLTPTECERLQTFPNGWTEGVSNTQRYKQLGNAVCVEVVRHIMEELRKDMNNKNEPIESGQTE